jgi:DNA (cytosine-5)-methyltransferase 1
MNYLSVCSGIEAATVAWHDMGWNPVGFSEIEKFPSEVLKHHYPTVTNFGDMTKYKEWQIDKPVGLLVGGTPCQSFSVAGLRKGLADPRGNLALTYCGILDHFRPKWFVWENVPGVLSSGNGRDFGSFLGALVELGYGFSYRVLDAQYFGVAQRRRRVFVVGHLGDWKPTAEVLFEPESLFRNIKPSREKGEEAAKCLTTRIRNDFETENFVTYCAPKAPTLLSSAAGLSRPGSDATADSQYIAYALPIHPQAMQFEGGGKNRNNDGKGNGLGVGNINDPMFTLTTADRHSVALGFNTNARPDEMNFLENQSNTLTKSQNSEVFKNMAVRRLTEVECERLQGFPDNYTNIKENCPSGPRYKALGNSMAVPVMKWIGQRINEYEVKHGTSD